MCIQAQYQDRDHVQPIALIGLIAPGSPRASSNVDDTPGCVSDSSFRTPSIFRAPNLFFVMKEMIMI